MNDPMIESNRAMKNQAANSDQTKEAATEPGIDANLKQKDKQTILILINPHSGRGKSVKLYKTKLVPLLNSRGIDHVAFITESESRVSDYINSKSTSELCSYKSIIVVSGDGLFHELVNAIMSRSDKDQVLQVPIGIVPTGSGNGLAYTLIRQKQPNIKSVDEAIKLCSEQAIQDKTCPADLVKITFGHATTIWSFLSVGWGLLSDIDIDSEWLRRFGELRFTVYGILRAMTSVSYRGKLSFKLAPTGPTSSTNGLCNDNYEKLDKSNNLTPTLQLLYHNSKDSWVHIEGKFACLYAVHQSYISRVTKFAPKSSLTDQLIYLTYVQGKMSFCQVIKFLLAIEDGSHENLPFVTVVPVTSFKFEPLEASKIVIDGEHISWNLSDGPLTAEVVPKAIKLAWSA